MSRRARQESPPADYPVVDPVTDYEKIKRIGEGTYGVVCKSQRCSLTCPSLVHMLLLHC